MTTFPPEATDKDLTELSGMELMQAMLENDSRPGLAGTLDIRLVEIDDGHAVLEGVPDTHLYNPFGVVHGGFTATMLDFACGYAVCSKLAAKQFCSTVEIKVTYHKPITADTGPVRAVGTVVTFGKRIAYTEAKLLDAQGQLLASATSNLMILAA